MNLVYLIISCIFFIVIVISSRKYSNDIQKFITFLIVGFAISLIIAIFSLQGAEDLVSKVVCSIIYACQTVILGENVDLIKMIPHSNIINIFYSTYCYFLILVLPLLTASFLLTLINDFLSKKKKLIIFSNFDERFQLLVQWDKNNKKI